MTKFCNASAIALTLVAGLALVGAAPAFAQSADQSPGVSVHYDDLDTTSAAGARVLLQRIKTAATVTCGGEPDIHQLVEHEIFDQCRDEAVSNAVRKVGAPMVTAMAKGADKSMTFAGR